MKWIEVPPKGALGERQIPQAISIIEQFFLRPWEALDRLTKYSDIGKITFKLIVISVILFDLENFVLIRIGDILAFPNPGNNILNEILLNVLFLIPVFIGLSAILSFFYNGLTFLIAKANKGNGTFKQQLFFQWASMIPLVGLYFFVATIKILLIKIPSFVLLLTAAYGVSVITVIGYFLLWQTLSLQRIHNFSFEKALLTSLAGITPMVYILFGSLR